MWRHAMFGERMAVVSLSAIRLREVWRRDDASTKLYGRL